MISRNQYDSSELLESVARMFEEFFHVEDNTCNKMVCLQCVFITSLKTYRVIQEERSVFWEVIVRVVVRISAHELVYNSEWLPKKSCLNLKIQKRCEWK